MSSLFSVSKFLAKSRSKPSRRDTAAPPTRTSSLLSVVDKEKERKSSIPPFVPPVPPLPSVAVTVEQSPPTKSDAPAAGPSTEPEPEPEPVSTQPSPPLESTEPVPVLPQVVDEPALIPQEVETRGQEQAAFVEEPEPAILPLPQAEPQADVTNDTERVVPLEELIIADVSLPEASVSETEWSALEIDEKEEEKETNAEVVTQVGKNDEVVQAPLEDAELRKDDETLAVAVEEVAAPSDQRREIENALRLAKEELQSALEELRVEILRMSVDMEKLKTEKEEVTAIAAQEKQELQEEILRLKGIIEIERLDNRERVASLEKENEAHVDHIIFLERRIEDQKEEVVEVERRNRELEIKLQRHEDHIADGRDVVAEKENHIRMVELNNENLASQLLRLQISLNGAKRQNHMLMDQLRQQANELQISKMGPSRIGAALFGTRGMSNAPPEVRAGHAIATVKLLNEEIFQTAASLTDRLENVSKRFVIEDESAAALAEMLKSMLGLELVKTLQKEASNTPEDFSPFIQIALQGCLIASCMHIITSWYPPEWDYASFLYALYERIRGTGGLAIALPWRKATQQNCVPSSDRSTKLIAYLTEQVHALLTVCGWSKQSEVEDILREKYAKRIADMVSHALQLNSLTTAGGNGELEAVIVEPGKMFDGDKMVNDTPLGSDDEAKIASSRPPAEEVVCTVALGLKRVDTAGLEAEHILLKPKVVLNGVLW